MYDELISPSIFLHVVPTVATFQLHCQQASEQHVFQDLNVRDLAIL
jgi:hypothetical protein